MKSKILKITGISLLILTCFVWSAPRLFKGKITHLVRAHFYKDLRAHVQFRDVDISLFRHFPKITIGLDSLQVTCVGEFQGDTLLTAKQFDVVCDLRSFIPGDSIRIYSISLDEPRIHAFIHQNGHANWNIIKRDNDPDEMIDSSSAPLYLALKGYAIHNGYMDYQDERRKMQVEVFNLEHEGKGNFDSAQFTLKTKTTAEAIHFDYNGTIPYRVTARTSIDMDFLVDNTTHTWSFNTDQISLNDLKLHSDGFFQWLNDSSYNMNIKFKQPSTKFKDFLSMMPSLYQKDFASIESKGQVNFNGFIKGKYDEKHFPAYHMNLFVLNGYFKYPDLPVAAENISLGLQVDNPDGIRDHTLVNISKAHAEIYHDTLDMHLLVKNPVSKPSIDFAFAGKLDLASISQCIKLEPGTKWSGMLIADIHAKGKIAESGKKKKDAFTSWGDFYLSDFLYSSKAYPAGISVNESILSFHSKNILIQELKATYLKTHLDATGSLDNLFDFAFRNKPLKASLDVKADECNLREWLRKDHDTSANASAHDYTTFAVPEHIEFNIHAETQNLHFDNLDLQNLSGNLFISDQTIHLQDIKANGLDGDFAMEGTYSTSESRENPEIRLSYNVRGLDIQKTFLAFYTARKIMPVAKFMAGSFNAHMTMNGRLLNDMTTDLATLQGEGNVQLLAASLKDFGPMDKVSQSLDIAALKCILLTAVHADFSYKSGKVLVSPFLVHAKDIDMEISGGHGFDQSIDYTVNLKVPRSELGNKGSMFVKNVVNRAADKGIPVRLSDAVPMNVKMIGTINSPEVKADMDAEVDHAETDLKKEVDAFVNAKLDSAKQQLHKPATPAKKQLFIQTSNKSKTKVKVKAKKHSKTTHKKPVHSQTKKKKKKPVKNYTLSAKKEKSVVSNSK